MMATTIPGGFIPPPGHCLIGVRPIGKRNVETISVLPTERPGYCVLNHTFGPADSRYHWLQEWTAGKRPEVVRAEIERMQPNLEGFEWRVAECEPERSCTYEDRPKPTAPPEFDLFGEPAGACGSFPKQKRP